MTPTLEVIRGIRIIVESPCYKIRDNEEDGIFVFHDNQQKRFKLINTLCSPEEMSILNVNQLALRVLDGLNTRYFPQNPIKSVVFDSDKTGLRNS